MKSPTNQLTDNVLGLLAVHNIFAFRINTMGVPRRVTGGKIIFSPSPHKGISDIISIYKGHFIGIELKIGYDKQSQEQKQFEQDVKRSGGCYFIASDIEDVANFFLNKFDIKLL